MYVYRLGTESEFKAFKKEQVFLCCHSYIKMQKKNLTMDRDATYFFHSCYIMNDKPVRIAD